MPTRSAVALSLAIIALVPPTPAGAQSWTPVRGAPGPALQDVCILPDGVHGWAVGGSGAAGQVLGCVLRTVDGGANWTPLPFPNPTGVALNGVDFVDPATGWVVGSGGAIYRTLDGGDTWTPQASGTSRKLSKVCFVDAERGWAAGGWGDGSAYLVLRTQNGGLTWQSQSFGTTAHSCDDVVFVDELNGWICGYDSSFNPHIHRTANGGTTWTRQTVPIAGSNATASSIDFVSPTEGWATISSLYVSPVGPILHTTNGGTTWTVQGYTGLHYDYAIDARDALHAAITSVQILPPAQERVFVTAPTAAERAGPWSGRGRGC
jgi:photosystem II stability/assembly factor-like uncharacterized protein